jgi:transposase-like protein
MACPRCMSVSATKDGTTQLGGQRFRCGLCGRRFTRRSSSAFTGRAFPDDIIALAVRWYLRYRLSYAEVSEWLAERGVLVDQSTIYRWVQRFLPLLGEVARKYRAPTGPDWPARRDLGSDPRPLALHLSSHRRPRPNHGCVSVSNTRHDCRAPLLPASHRFQRDDATPGHHRQGSSLSGSPHPGCSRSTPSDRSVSYERDREGTRVSKGEALADARTQVCCLGTDLHVQSRLMRNIRHRFYRIVDIAGKSGPVPGFVMFRVFR